MLAAAVLLPALCGVSRADTLSSQSSVGVASAVNTNPFLVSSGAQTAESVAVLANLPATYTSDTQTIDLTPRFRFAETHGPVALLSDYEYLDGDWHWNSERNTFTATAELHHDSTLYNDFENAALLGRDVGRLEEDANLAWQRALSERSDVQLSGSWDRVAYSQDSTSSLSNFTYTQGTLEYDRNLSELWKWSASAGYGRYDLLDGAYSSDERFIQTTLTAQLSERWSATAEGGYAYLSAHAQGYACCELAVGPSGGLYYELIPVSQVYSRGTPNYAVSAEYKDERLVLDLAYSSLIQPSGLGALLTQDNASVRASLPLTERLSLSAAVRWSRISDSLGRLDLEGRQIYGVNLSANWQWTEYWTVGLNAAYLRQYLAALVPPGAGVTVEATLSRQFGRIRL